MSNKQDSDLVKALINSGQAENSEVAKGIVNEIRNRVLEGEDPEEILHDEYSLEPDYVLDVLYL